MTSVRHQQDRGGGARSIIMDTSGLSSLRWFNTEHLQVWTGDEEPVVDVPAPLHSPSHQLCRMHAVIGGKQVANTAPVHLSTNVPAFSVLGGYGRNCRKAYDDIHGHYIAVSICLGSFGCGRLYVIFGWGKGSCAADLKFLCL